MRRQPKRKGISLGTITMLTVTVLVVLGCFWLFPRLMGDVDLQLDASKLAVSIDKSLSALTSGETPAFEGLPDGLPQETSTPTPVLVTTPPTVSFSLTATGSVAINQAVQKALTDSSGYRFPILFEALKSEIGSHLAIATLENTVVPTEKLSDSNVPTDVVSALAEGGLTGLYLGYEGALNQGISGLRATQDSIRSAGMVSYGVYDSPEARQHPQVLNVNGVSVALLGYQSELSSAAKKKLSKEELAFAVAPPNLPVIQNDIAAAKAAGAQIILVSLCWGKPGASEPSDTQRELAQAIADAGADIILGTHSGTVQSVELLTAYRTGGQQSQTLCAYSLGNLFAYNRDKRANISGILLHMNVTYHMASGKVQFDDLSYSPTYVWRGKEDGKTLYRVLVSDVPPPGFVDAEQKDIMGRSLTLIDDVMKATPATRRTQNQVAPGR